MKTIVLAAAAVAGVLPVATAEASNSSVARQRMTAQLFAERGGEVSYKDAGDPRSGLVFLETVECGGEVCHSWRPAKLNLSCHRNRCTGQLVVTKEISPTHEAEELCASKGGQFVLEGNQGQYPGVPLEVSEVFVCEYAEGRKEVISAKVSTSETYVALVDHATFRGRKGTYHESRWEPPS